MGGVVSVGNTYSRVGTLCLLGMTDFCITPSIVIAKPRRGCGNPFSLRQGQPLRHIAIPAYSPHGRSPPMKKDRLLPVFFHW